MQYVFAGVVITAACFVASCEQRTNRPTESQSEDSVPSLAGSVPMSSEAADLLGKHLVLDELDWLNTPDNKPIKLAGKVTLVRWWTDTCPSCAMSLPCPSRKPHPEINPRRDELKSFDYACQESFQYAGLQTMKEITSLKLR